MKGAIFDMDGVLFDTEVLYERFWCEAANQLGFNMLPHHVAAIRSTDSRIAEQILKTAFGQDFSYQQVRELRKSLMASYIEQYGISIKEGVIDILSCLYKKYNCRIALATTSNYSRAEEYLQRANIRNYFQCLVCGDMISKGKPDPCIYLTAAEKLGVLPEECWAFEDSYNGVRSAYAAGCKTIMLMDRDLPNEEMKQKTIGIYRSFQEVKMDLKGLSNET